jgi:hypothetical protein
MREVSAEGVVERGWPVWHTAGSRAPNESDGASQSLRPCDLWIEFRALGLLGKPSTT